MLWMQGLNNSFPANASFTMWHFRVQALVEYRSPLPGHAHTGASAFVALHSGHDNNRAHMCSIISEHM